MPKDVIQATDTEVTKTQNAQKAIEQTAHSQDLRSLVPLKQSIPPAVQDETYKRLAEAALKGDQKGFDAISKADGAREFSTSQKTNNLNVVAKMVFENQEAQGLATANTEFKLAGKAGDEATAEEARRRGEAGLKSTREADVQMEKRGYIPSADDRFRDNVRGLYKDLEGNSTAQQDMLRAAAEIAPLAIIELAFLLDRQQNNQTTAMLMATNLAFAVAFMKMFDDFIDAQNDERARKEYTKKQKELEEQGVGTKIDETKIGKIESIIHAEVPVRMNIPTTLYIHNHLSELVPRVNPEFRAKEVM
jgi:hypothetical protein